MGPTAATSGAPSILPSGCCNNQPTGALNLTSSSWLSKICWPIDSAVGVTIPVRSGSTYGMYPETLAVAIIVVLIILTCSGSTGLSLVPVVTAAILSSVSKLSSVASLPNAVYSPSRKFESWWTIKNC